MNPPHHDMSSPSHSLQYLYGEAEQYFDHANSESQSSMGSPVSEHLPPAPLLARPPADAQLQYDFYVQDFAAGDQYSSPEGDAESPEAQPAVAAKAPAKRKRENRYKNAPPSVLSVRALSRPVPCLLPLWISAHAVRTRERSKTPYDSRRSRPGPALSRARPTRARSPAWNLPMLLPLITLFGAGRFALRTRFPSHATHTPPRPPQAGLQERR